MSVDGTKSAAHHCDLFVPDLEAFDANYHPVRRSAIPERSATCQRHDALALVAPCAPSAPACALAVKIACARAKAARALREMYKLVESERIARDARQDDTSDLAIARKDTLRSIIAALDGLTPEHISILLKKTKRGNTQATERNAIAVLGSCFCGMGLCFDSAGTQQPYDFINVGPEGVRGYSRHELKIRLEHKHTNGNKIICNDTPPSDRGWTFYVLCKSPTKRTRGFVALVSSAVLRSGSEAYIRTCESFIRGVLRPELKKLHKGAMSAFPRANYSCNLGTLDIEQNADYIRFIEAG